MRPSVAAALALFVLAPNAKAQAARQTPPFSFEAAARAGISRTATAPGSGVHVLQSDTSSAHHASVGRGAAIGFTVGFIVGATVGAISVKGTSKEDRQLKLVAAAANGLIGGLIGGVAGAFIASRHHSQ